MRDAGPGNAQVDSVHQVQHISGKDNAMADMLSRARFDDEGGMVSEDKEVGVDFFEAAYVTTDGTSTPALNDFRRFLEDNDAGCVMDKGRGQPDPEESIPILSPGQIPVEAPEEEERRPAPSDGDEGRTRGAVEGLP